MLGFLVGLVNKVTSTKKDAVDEALKMAVLYASKSPVAVQRTKELLNHSWGHSVYDSKRKKPFLCAKTDYRYSP